MNNKSYCNEKSDLINAEPLMDDPKKRIEQLQAWVNSLQSQIAIDRPAYCGYCGYHYEPSNDTPVAMADVLKEHIKQCSRHPLSKAIEKIKQLQILVDQNNSL